VLRNRGERARTHPSWPVPLSVQVELLSLVVLLILFPSHEVIDLLPFFLPFVLLLFFPSPSSSWLLLSLSHLWFAVCEAPRQASLPASLPGMPPWERPSRLKLSPRHAATSEGPL